MPNMKFDMGKEGLFTLFKPYQVHIMEHLWDLNGESRVGLNSSQAWKYIQDTPERKSRSAVIFFLNDMVEEGVLDYEERTGKGGYHRVYYPLMDRDGFQKYITEKINSKLEKIFP